MRKVKDDITGIWDPRKTNTVAVHNRFAILDRQEVIESEKVSAVTGGRRVETMGRE